MKIINFVFLILFIPCLLFAESYQYVVVGTGNGKNVTGYLTGYDNGTLQGTVNDKFVSGEWTGYGICQVSDGQNLYEMEVTGD